MSVVGIEDELERLDRLILAAEDWAPRYRKNKKTFAKLIKFEARLERVMRRYFRELATERMIRIINWNAYAGKVSAYKFDVIVDVEEIDDEEDVLMNIMHDPLQQSLALGASSAEAAYNIDLGLNEYNSAVMRATDKYVGDLVKNINATTKDRIKASIDKSIRLGEDLDTAQRRLIDVIGDPRRARMIARTESVRSYSKGITLFGKESGATGKIWELSSSPCEICASNDTNGQPIPFDETFPSGDEEPPAHPNCRCTISLEHDYS